MLAFQPKSVYMANTVNTVPFSSTASGETRRSGTLNGLPMFHQSSPIAIKQCSTEPSDHPGPLIPKIPIPRPLPSPFPLPSGKKTVIPKSKSPSSAHSDSLEDQSSGSPTPSPSPSPASYTTSNKLLTFATVESILNFLGPIGDDEKPLKIKSLEIYQRAFVDDSFVAEPDPVIASQIDASKSYQVLEFLGDSFVGAAVTQYLFDRFEDERQGFCTVIKHRIVEKRMLARFARFLSLQEYILLSPTKDRTSTVGSMEGRDDPALCEDCFEAFIGAIILDFGDFEGYRYVKRLIVKLMEQLVDFSDLILNNDNYKTTLQAYFTTQKWNLPIYVDLKGDSRGRHSKDKEYVRGVFLPYERLTDMKGHVRRNAQDYQRQIVKNNPAVSQKILNHARDSKCVLIGFAKDKERKDSEQVCAKMALICLSVPTDFKAPSKKF